MILLKTNVPRWFNADALTIAPFILVTEDHAEDEALLAHEMVHYKEQLRYLVLPWWALYLLSRKFRMNAEVRAYKVQIEAGLDLEMAAWYLEHLYFLKITREEALEALKK